MPYKAGKVKPYSNTTKKQKQLKLLDSSGGKPSSRIQAQAQAEYNRRAVNVARMKLRTMKKK